LRSAASLEKRRAACRAYDQVHREERKQRQRDRYWANPEKYRILGKQRLSPHRQKVRTLFGNVCNFCGTTGLQLELAHKEYAADSIKPDYKGGGQPAYLARVREALNHPERFYFLCRPCHGAFDQVKKVTGIDIVRAFGDADWRTKHA